MRLLRTATDPPAAAPKAASTASCCCCWSASACRAASTASNEPSLGGGIAAAASAAAAGAAAGVQSWLSCCGGAAPSCQAAVGSTAAGPAGMLQELPDSRLVSPPPPDDLGAAPRSPVGRAPGEGAPICSRVSGRPPLLPPANRKDRLRMPAAPGCSLSPAAAGSSITGRTRGLPPAGGGSASVAGAPAPCTGAAASWVSDAVPAG